MSESTSTEHRLNDSVEKHAKADFAKIHVDQTVADAIAELRSNPPKGRIIYFYAVDSDDRLAGIVPTRRLLLSPADSQINDVMEQNVIAIPKRATVLEACEFFLFHKLLAFPVIDEQRRMIGIVDVTLYTEELSDLDRREGHDQLFQLIGVHASDARPDSVLQAFQSRFPWLLANIGGGLMAAFISGIFQVELQKAVALALFIPIVLALAESVSIQSVSLALQVMRGKKLTLKSIMKRFQSEAQTGVLLGLGCGVIVSSIAAVWLGQFTLVLCIFGGIVGGVTVAAMIGFTISNLLRYFHRDPQVAAGPIALATTDMATLVLYFSLARWLLA